MIVANRKPFEPLPSGAYRRMDKITGVASPRRRDRTVASSISQEAFDLLYADAQKLGASIAGMNGVVVDYLVRTGKFAALLQEALREGQE